MKYTTTDSESESVDDEMLINLYENPINRESLEKIPGTNTHTHLALTAPLALRARDETIESTTTTRVNIITYKILKSYNACKSIISHWQHTQKINFLKYTKRFEHFLREPRDPRGPNIKIAYNYSKRVLL